MRIKISDRMTDVKTTRWINGEIGVFNKSELNANVNDIDYVLLKNRGVIYYDMSWMDNSFDSVGVEW